MISLDGDSHAGRAARGGTVVKRIGFWPRTVVAVAKPILNVVTQRDWQRMDRIPTTGGVIIAANHMSEFDPLVVAHFVYDSGRWPQFLAKSTLFKVPVLGSLIKAVRQIPVERGTVDASKALGAAWRRRDHLPRGHHAEEG